MLKVNINGLDFKNPVIAASGTFGFGAEYNNFYDVGILGGISSKGLTLNEKAGNYGIRVFETPSGMMNSVGLQNPGIDKFIAEELPKMKKLGTNIIANVGGGCMEDYEIALDKLNGTDVDMIELNISCPNVKEGGIAFGQRAESAMEITSAVKKVSKKPIIMKLSPNVTDITEMAKAVEAGGADAVSLINTLTGMKIDINRRTFAVANKTGGLSGPAIKPVAVRMVYQVANAVNIPIIGMGGIASAEDALEFIMAGATMVAVGTANFNDPMTTIKVIEGIQSFMEKNGIKDIAEITGCVK